MRIVCYDTEFIEDGTTIDLVSIGAVDNCGNEFYRVSTEFNPEKANMFVQENVFPQLPPPGDGRYKPRRWIACNWLDFMTLTDEPVELWAYYGAYDHVALAQLYGTMIRMPRIIPMYTHELMQLWEDAGQPTMPVHGSDHHDALADARWGMNLYEACREVISRDTCMTASP